MDKLIISKEQEKALEIYLSHENSMDLFVADRHNWSNSYRSLKNFSIDQFARLMYEPDSYKVQPNFIIGELVKFKIEMGDYQFGVITDINGDEIWAKWNNRSSESWAARKYVEEVTPEEANTYWNEQKWRDIGREVGEFKEHDVVVYDGDYFKLFKNMGCEIYNKHMSPEYASKLYAEGQILEFYPADTAVKFDPPNVVWCEL